MKFYLYQHIRLDTNEIFYVGKGTYYNKSDFKSQHLRAFSSNKRNKYWNRIINKTQYKVEIIGYFNDEQEAFDNEFKTIKLLKSRGLCKANLNDGGQGGYNPSPEVREKLSKSQTGRKYSQKDKAKLKGKNNSNWAGYCHTPYGIYESSTAAAKSLNVSKMTISRRCHNDKFKDWYLI